MRLAVKTFLALGALVLAGGCAWVDRRADLREAAAARMWPPLGRFVEVDGRRVHAWTEGAGPDLILLHGASGNMRDFTFGFAQRLTGRYRVTVFDRPGLGYTDRASDDVAGAFNPRAESPQDQAAMLHAAARAIGIERPIVLGHSYGGAVAMAWALGHDPAALVVVSGATMPWPGDLGPQYRILGSPVGGASLPPLVTAFAGDQTIDRAIESIFAPQAAPDDYAEYVGPGLTVRRRTLRANARQVNTLRPHVVAMSRQYGTLDLPVEIVHGTADDIVPLEVHARPLAGLAPGARLAVLDGIGHMPHHVAPEAVLDAIDRAAARAGLR